MAARLNEANNWIRQSFSVDLNHHEDAADFLVRTMGTYCSRSVIKPGATVRLRHIEMSAHLFERIGMLHRAFPAFRMTSYSTLKGRGVLGQLCGVTVYENSAVDDALHFQYQDVYICENASLPDPAFINHPKATMSGFPEHV